MRKQGEKNKKKTQQKRKADAGERGALRCKENGQKKSEDTRRKER